jgi:hypothetical protein
MKLLQYCLTTLVPDVKLKIPWQLTAVFLTLEKVVTTVNYYDIFVT